MSNVEEFEQLLKAPPPRRPRTFLEVSGYPHLENVLSNILSFYLDPKAEHKLEDVVLRGLMEVACLKATDVGSDVTIEREVWTAQGKRIDIVAETEAAVIGVENKVNAPVANDLEEYRAYVECRARKNGKTFKTVLLSVRPLEAPVDAPEREEWEKWKKVTYEELFSKILAGVGSHLVEADSTYVGYLTDVVRTVTNLARGYTMSEEFLRFAERNREPLIELFSRVRELKREERQKVRSVGATVGPRGEVQPEAFTEPSDLYDLVRYRMRSVAPVILVYAAIEPGGWTFWIEAESGVDQEVERWVHNIPHVGHELLRDEKMPNRWGWAKESADARSPVLAYGKDTEAADRLKRLLDAVEGALPLLDAASQ